MATFTIDAEVFAPWFTLDAVILGAGRWQHHRIDDHYGSDSDLLVVLSTDIGPYVAYTPIHYVLESIMARLASLETKSKVRGSFTTNAWFSPGGAFTISSRVVPWVRTGSFTMDAAYGQGLTFAADAFIAGALTLDAFVI